ncbi:MAG: TetR/AcrR family transcriptional regulator, partial [Baekduiaceae bacterium]
MATPAPRRLPPDERRRQLVGIGLRMLTERPITEITVDDVAREAGISRSLLFNYFPSKRDYHLAVIRAAARRVRRVVLVDGDEGVPVILDRFLAFLERRRDPYLSLLRGVGGADPDLFGSIPLYQDNRYWYGMTCSRAVMIRSSIRHHPLEYRLL